MHFQYDEYQWQYKNKIKIDDSERVRGLHKILYRCPHCKKEDLMQSHGHSLICDSCGKTWEMSEYGRMHSPDGETEFEHIPHWYEYQRDEVKKEIINGKYQLRIEVTIDALPNEKGFVSLGQGTLTHNLVSYSNYYFTTWLQLS